MDRPTPPGSTPTPSQRTLAAIVFTDVVGFSARMQRDEVGTLKLLQRDFDEMRRLSVEHEGSVLKTTGDGLLLTFSSAVHAVACALAMQRQFAAEAKETPGNGALQHRIGIHLGDILVQNQDVMGDGVNIASRLQAEAEPGGICISQTVYDVVKNKLEMHAVSLGPRELKNITQAMPVYRILLEAQALGATGSKPPIPAAAPVAAPAVKAAVPPSSSQRRLLVSAGLVVVLFLIFAGSLMISRRTEPVPAPVSTPAPSPTPVATPPPAPVTKAPAPAVADAGQAAPKATPALTDAEFQREAARRKEGMQQLRTQYLDKYDFDGLVRALGDKNNPVSSRPGVQTMLNSGKQMLTLRNWIEFDLAHYNRQKPLTVHDLSGDPAKDARVFTNANLQLVFLANGTPTPHEWADLKPADIGSIIVSAISEAKPLPAREIFQGAQTFAQIYSLPSMRDAITAIRSGRRQQGQVQQGQVQQGQVQQGQVQQGQVQQGQVQQGQVQKGQSQQSQQSQEPEPMLHP